MSTSTFGELSASNEKLTAVCTIRERTSYLTVDRKCSKYFYTTNQKKESQQEHNLTCTTYYECKQRKHS
jgi:hypothetical protein